jgi:hypothetical protein
MAGVSAGLTQMSTRGSVPTPVPSACAFSQQLGSISQPSRTSRSPVSAAVGVWALIGHSLSTQTGFLVVLLPDEKAQHLPREPSAPSSPHSAASAPQSRAWNRRGMARAARLTRAASSRVEASTSVRKLRRLRRLRQLLRCMDVAEDGSVRAVGGFGPADRSETSFVSKSNQNGAPSITKSAVTIQPPMNPTRLQ